MQLMLNFDLNNMINPMVATSQIRKSHKMAKLSKKKSYGYYVNLCKKYNMDILKRPHFQPHMIREVERLNLVNQYTNEIDLN